MGIAVVKTMGVGQIVRCGASLIRCDKCKITSRGVDLIVSRIKVKGVRAIDIAAFDESSPGSKTSTGLIINLQVYWIANICSINGLGEVITQTQTMNCLS